MKGNDPTDHDLVAAYLDGVTELDADERRRVEALLREPATRADADELHTTLGALRGLGPSAHGGQEPDWAVLERDIRMAVGPTVPASWWRRLRWVAPIGALAVTAAIAMLWIHHAEPEQTAQRLISDGGTPALAPAAREDSNAIWLDGQAVEIGDVDPMVLLDDSGGEDVTADTNGLLPVQDLQWVDALDDTAAERVESWLAKKKKKG